MDAQLLIPLVLVMVAIGGAVFAVASGVHTAASVASTRARRHGHCMLVQLAGSVDTDR